MEPDVRPILLVRPIPLAWGEPVGGKRDSSATPDGAAPHSCSEERSGHRRTDTLQPLGEQGPGSDGTETPFRDLPGEPGPPRGVRSRPRPPFVGRPPPWSPSLLPGPGGAKGQWGHPGRSLPAVPRSWSGPGRSPFDPDSHRDTGCTRPDLPGRRRRFFGPGVEQRFLPARRRPGRGELPSGGGEQCPKVHPWYGPWRGPGGR